MSHLLDTNQIIPSTSQVFSGCGTDIQTEELIPESSVQDLRYVDLTGRIYHKIKRILDLAAAMTGLVFCLLPCLLIAAAIYVDDPGKVLFAQYRIGLGGKPFRLYKFRTMRMDTPQYLPTNAVKDPDHCITRVGKFLRITSLDELPQLLNVIKGDMSLVGPRPLIAEEYEIHNMRMRFGVYNIRPGITGLAQVNGRDAVSAANKVRMDVAYLEQFGFGEDLKILLSTLPKLSGDDGVMEGYNANLKE